MPPWMATIALMIATLYVTWWHRLAQVFIYRKSTQPLFASQYMSYQAIFHSIRGLSNRLANSSGSLTHLFRLLSGASGFRGNVHVSYH